MTTRCSLTYLVNDVPRGVSPKGLICFLASLVNGSAMTDFEVSNYTRNNPESSYYGDLSSFKRLVEDVTVTDSQLDDELSVAIIKFKDTPKWFKIRDSDPYGFPKKTKLGTIWKGVDMTTKDRDGRTAFIRAVIDGNLKLAETLAEYQETDINAQDNQGMTALHWACKNGLADLTAFCLSLPELDVGVKSDAGLTAFDIAYREALWDDNDAIPTLFYKSMFEMDEYDPDNALLRLLTLTTDPRGKTLFPQEALFSPSRNGNLALVQVLLRNMVSTDPIVTNRYKETALHMAAGGGHATIVSLLLDHARFDVNAVTKEGCTALHYAAREGYTQTVKELVDRGASLDTEGTHGHTALDLALQNEHESTVRFLLERGARMKLKDKTDNQIARAEAVVRMTKLLRERGNDINGKDEEGLTALHNAVFVHDPEVVRMLLDQGADIEERFWTWKTAVEIAEEKRNNAIVELLIERGAKTSEENSREREAKLLRSINPDKKKEQATPEPLHFENVVADFKPDIFDVTDMEMPLDQEADTGILSPIPITFSRSETPDNEGYQETRSSESHHELEDDAHLPVFIELSRCPTPEGKNYEDFGIQQEVNYDDNPAQEYGWSAPTRSNTPEPAEHQNTETYDGDYEAGGGYIAFWQQTV